MIYVYCTALGLATVHKMYDDGNDHKDKPKKLGRFKTEAEAKEACLLHYEKVVKSAENFGRPIPKKLFM